LNNDKAFVPGELVETYDLRGGYNISDICGTTSSAQVECFSGDNFTDLTIVFRRPDLDATIKGFNSNYDFESVEISIQSPRGENRKVKVFSTGQISVVTNP